MSSKTVPNEFEAGQPGHLDGLPGAPMSFGFRKRKHRPSAPGRRHCGQLYLARHGWFRVLWNDSVNVKDVNVWCHWCECVIIVILWFVCIMYHNVLYFYITSYRSRRLIMRRPYVVRGCKDSIVELRWIWHFPFSPKAILAACTDFGLFFHMFLGLFSTWT